MIRLEPRVKPSSILVYSVPILAAGVALLLSSIFLLISGKNLWHAYQLLFLGAFGGVFAFTETLVRATPLILTGLAATVAFRTKFWNIGAEGQFYLGGLVAVIVGSGAIQAPTLVLLPLVLFTGALAGSLVLLVPALLKVYFKTDEVVTTLLLNFIILLFVQMMLEGPLQDPMALGWPQSAPIVDQAVLPPLIDKFRVHSGLLVSLIAAFLVFVLMRFTVLGFKLRAVGENAKAAQHAGISVPHTMLWAAIISGALAGLAGVGEVVGLKGYLTADISPGYGYAGIVVAMLARLSPIGVIVSALFIAMVFVGADSMSRELGVSSYLADIIVALSLLCVLVGGVFTHYRIRWIRR